MWAPHRISQRLVISNKCFQVILDFAGEPRLPSLPHDPEILLNEVLNVFELKQGPFVAQSLEPQFKPPNAGLRTGGRWTAGGMLVTRPTLLTMYGFDFTSPE